MKIKPMQLRHPREKMLDVVKILALGRGDARSRLQEASLEFLAIVSSELPEHLQAEYNAIHSALTQYPQKRDEGRIAATMARIKNATASKIAGRMWEFSQLLDGAIRDGEIDDPA